VALSPNRATTSSPIQWEHLGPTQPGFPRQLHSCLHGSLVVGVQVEVHVNLEPVAGFAGNEVSIVAILERGITA
jgi:hypothetical protein